MDTKLLRTADDGLDVLCPRSTVNVYHGHKSHVPHLTQYIRQHGDFMAVPFSCGGDNKEHAPT
jgi:hypothetical protein